MVQPYIKAPLIVNRRKFHIRLYLVVPQWHPTVVLRHKEALVLFATKPYAVRLSV